jgi:hypothetical protein
MRDSNEFSGEIGRATADGACAVVVLDHEVAGVRYAVINHETSGRIALMNKTGRLERGRRVTGSGPRGPDAIKAETVVAAYSPHPVSFRGDE